MFNFIKKHKKISILIAIIAFIFVIYFFFIRSGVPDYNTMEVKRGSVVQNVSPTGTVTPAKEIALRFEVSGKINAIPKEEGEKVSTGESIVILKNGELRAELTSKQASLERAQTELNQALSGTRNEELEVYRSAVNQAGTQVKTKEKNLEDTIIKAENDLQKAYEDAPDILYGAYYNTGKAVNENLDDIFNDDNTDTPEISFNTGDGKARTDAENKRRIAGDYLTDLESLSNVSEEDREKIENNLSEVKNILIFMKDFLSDVSGAVNAGITSSSFTQSTLSTYKSNVSSAKSNINTALTNVNTQIQLIETTEINNKNLINSAESAIEEAEASLEKANRELELKEAGYTKDEISLKKSSIKQAEAEVLRAQEKLEKYIIHSPIEGVITKIEKEVGETISAGKKIASVISSGPFQIEANVSEAEIAKVEINDPVVITLDAFGPERKFEGKVVKIDPAETIISGVIYYQITAEFNAEDPKIKPGMTANLEIQTDKKDNALYLPYFVVQRDGGKRLVDILLPNGNKETREIKTGLEGEMKIEVTEGLNEGDLVILDE